MDEENHTSSSYMRKQWTKLLEWDNVRQGSKMTQAQLNPKSCEVKKFLDSKIKLGLIRFHFH